MDAAAHLRALVDYNQWANERILDAAEELGADDLTRTPGGSASILDNLSHIVGAQMVWLDRWEGEERDHPARPTLAAVRDALARSHEELRRYVGALTDADWSRIIRYRTKEGEIEERPLGLLVAHLVNHGTQHRSEVAALLTALGRSPGELDLVKWSYEYL